MRRATEGGVDGFAITGAYERLAEADVIEGRCVDGHHQARLHRAAEVDQGDFFAILEALDIIAGHHRTPPVDIARFEGDHARVRVFDDAGDELIEAGLDVIVLVAAQHQLLFGDVGDELEGARAEHADQTVIFTPVFDRLAGHDARCRPAAPAVEHHRVRPGQRQDDGVIIQRYY